MVDIARQVRYESLVTKNVAGGLEADDEKPSWRAALQYLVTEILHKRINCHLTGRIQLLWDDPLVPHCATFRVMHQAAMKRYDTDEDDGQSHWFEDPQTAQVEGVLV